MFDIFKRVPVNKTAALVSSQAGCNERVTLIQELQFATARLAQLQDNTKKNGLEILRLNTRIRQLNLTIKEQRRSTAAAQSEEKQKKKAINNAIKEQEWQEFFRSVCDEIGRDRALDLKKAAEVIARSKVLTKAH